MGHGGEEGAKIHGSEAGDRDKGSSSHDADGDWQTHGDPTAEMVGWGWAERRQGDSGGDGED